MKPELLAFERLLKIMDDLREKCPWDKKQTLESIHVKNKTIFFISYIKKYIG